jgi:hypothetical protein
MRRSKIIAWVVGILALAGLVYAAVEVPTTIKQPGTQPQEVSTLESPDKCDNCHGNYNPLVEPAHNWRGSMMANAGRDPIFWATLAIAEQDFDGAGDLCIRCHSTAGWLAGRSTPTDGSGLAAGDSDGVECDFCHKLTNPDDSDPGLQGIQIDPFVANDGIEGYYGSGMASIWPGNEKLGPYADTAARHQIAESKFHRSQEFCGTCHDVSNPAVGNLAPFNGTQTTADPVTGDGEIFGIVDTKTAFNYPPYMYGMVERTFSEHMSSSWPERLVSSYSSLPPELQAGAALAAYESAIVAGTGGNYEDDSDRYFTCQTCHMRPVEGAGCNKKGAPIRKDLPLHDMTGGNYWITEAIKYQDTFGMLRLGGGLSSAQISAMDDAAIRAKKQLAQAATLIVSKSPDHVDIVNHTGHKLITGYPEGRRMWLHVTWYDDNNTQLREDGAYGPLKDAQGDLVTITNPATGQPVPVQSILDLHDGNTEIYEAHYGMTQEWAFKLVDNNLAGSEVCLSYDRTTGDCVETLGDLAAAAPGSTHETFHFVLNDTVVKDNRIPPFGFRYDDARVRNSLPVPADQFGDPGPGGIYDHQDRFSLSPPNGATYAMVELMYQPTSWEYIQFLYLANTLPQGDFLADEGINMLEAWIETGMATPYVMASGEWGRQTTPPTPEMWIDDLSTALVGKRGILTPTDIFKSRDTMAVLAHVVDESGLPLSGAQVFVEITGPGGVEASLQAFTNDSGSTELRWKVPRNQTPGSYSATVSNIIKSGYLYQGGGTTAVPFFIQ